MVCEDCVDKLANEFIVRWKLNQFDARYLANFVLTTTGWVNHG